MQSTNLKNRGQFLGATAGAAQGIWAAPYVSWGTEAKGPLKRVLGRTGFETTTLGLGGQASLQWTPDDVDPEAIILKAFQLGVKRPVVIRRLLAVQQTGRKSALESTRSLSTMIVLPRDCDGADRMVR